MSGAGLVPPPGQVVPGAQREAERLEPPRVARRLVPRDDLLHRLREARRQRCIVVRGPAGSGKTSVLIAWRQALLTLDFDAAWLTLEPEDNGLSRFFGGLIASIGRADPAAVREAALLMGASEADESALEHRVIALVQGLAGRSRELVLMIDDLHHIHDPGVEQVLHWLLQYAPPQLHVALASRSALPPMLAALVGRLRDQQLASEFDMRDLRFSEEESRRFLAAQLGQLDAWQARALHELADGWVAGLQLFAVAMKSAAPRQAAPAQLRDAAAFADYFEQEVLRRQPAGDLELLIRAAACSRFCASLCAELLQQPDQAGALQARLARMDGDDLFLSQVQPGGAQPWYRLHPLLREVLLARLKARDPAELQQLHQRAWQWLVGHGDLDEAIHHAVLAGQADAAALQVERCARDLLDRGELDRMMALVQRLPAAQVQSRVGLRLAQAHVNLYARELGRLADDVAALSAMQLDARQQAELTVLKGGLALQRDDADAAAALLPDLQRELPEPDGFLESTRASLMAWVHMGRGDFARARHVLNEAAGPQAGRGLRLTIQCLTGLSHTMEGRVTEAERLYREVLQDADSQGPAFVGVSSMASALLADVLYEVDEVQRACELLEARASVIEHAAFPEAMLRTCIVLASAHWVSGRRLEALAQLDRLEDYASRDALDRLLAHALALRVRLLHQQGDTVAAAISRARLEALADRHAASTDAGSHEIRLMKLRGDIAAQLHQGDLDAAARKMEELLHGTEAAGRLRAAVQVQLQWAIVERGRGHARRADELLVEGLRRGHQLGLVRSVIDASRRVAGALSELEQRHALDPVLSFYLQRLLKAAARRHEPAAAAASAALSPEAEALKDREREILALLAQALPNKKIARVLGLSPETVKWHLKNIYAKLGVAGRDEAVARARDFGLVPLPPPVAGGGAGAH